MDQYTIYCTEEQTKKAFELGAPIKPRLEFFTPNLKETPHTTITIDSEEVILFIPTAEQMCSWIQKQGCYAYVIPVQRDHKDVLVARFLIPNHDGHCDVFCGYGDDNSVILKAIDEALNYLIRNKK